MASTNCEQGGRELNITLDPDHGSRIKHPAARELEGRQTDRLAGRVLSSAREERIGEGGVGSWRDLYVRGGKGGIAAGSVRKTCREKQDERELI